MNVIQFPARSGALSDEDLQKIRAEAIELSQILNNRLGRIEGEGKLDINEPIEYTVGDFYLLTKVLLLTRIEMDEHLDRIAKYLNGGEK